MGLALAGSLPIPAQAQGSIIDLEIGGEGATSWNIDRIEPGDSGTKTVELHNAGSRNGFVTIWISDIEEIDYGGDAAVLGDYLLFDLPCDRLSSNITFPATIYDLPQDGSDQNHIKINPLYAAETITLVWEWEFPETGEPQNDAQGDSLSFTINYLLEELPPGDGGGGWGGGGWGGVGPPPPRLLELTVDMWGTVTSGNMTEAGVLMETIEATSADGVLTLVLSQGTRVLDCLGNRLDLIEVEPVTPPNPLPDACVIAQAYQFEPCCTFDPSAEVIIHYDPQALGDSVDKKDLVIAHYDRAQQQWVVLPSVVDTGSQTVAASVGHFSMLAMLAPGPEVAPTSTPEGALPPAPEVALTPVPEVSPTSSSGLGAGAWIGIGIGILLLLGPIVWLLTRRR